MNDLIKNKWDSKNIEDFYTFLESLKRPERMEWTKNIVNTNKKCLAIPSNTLKEISNHIFKGNYISFLNLMPNKNHDSLIVDSYVVSKIKDFKVQKKYILKLAKYIDNWAVVDSLKFSVNNQEKEFLLFAKEMVNHKLPFYRRIGVRILFSLISYDQLMTDIYHCIDSFILEEDYYVNMALSWLLCELFIKRRKDTIEYLSHSHLNKFVINKFISKCRDSYRISNEDKLMLNSYRVM